MRYKTIILEKDEGIATLTLNRPRKYNALDTTMMRELQSALQAVGEDDEIGVLVITGAGPAFCSGIDVSMMQSMIDDASLEKAPLRHKLRFTESFYSVVLQLSNMAKPVIAAVNGVAAGGGLVLAMAADIRIASDRAGFSQVFARRGLPDGASTFFLPKLVGLGKAFELAFTGKVINAEEAERIGLVNQVVPNDELMKATRELAVGIVRGPAVALQLAKQALRRGFVATDLATHAEFELNSVLISIATEDFKEGVKSFLEKREPRFTGR